MDEQLPSKKDAADALLERGSLFVHLDPRREGVIVPDHLRGRPQLVLQFGLGLAVPIRDLHVDDEGISGTLSFNRSPFACFVPWSAAYLLVNDDEMGVVWRDDLPDELREEVEQAEKKSARPALRAIRGGDAARATQSTSDADASDSQTSDSDASDSQTEPAEPSRPSRGHLRLIK